MRARALVLVVLLVSYGAVGARQPAVRMAVPLPLSSQEMADALEIASVDRSQFVVHVIRTMIGMGMLSGEKPVRLAFRQLLDGAAGTGEMVPLPLDASIWRDTLLLRPVPNEQIIAAILSNRQAALLYHGLAGLDDETLAWLGAERETLRILMRHAGAFAIFGPSIRIQSNKVVVPGGPEAEELWQAIVGAEASRPAAFVRRLFNTDGSHLAWFYDAVSQLDANRMRFALGASLPAASRVERTRALVEVFSNVAREWNPEHQPFSRRPLDPALTLAIIDANPDGTVVGPSDRAFWERVFADDAAGPIGTGPRDIGISGESAPLDAAWLSARINRVPLDLGRRRLDTFGFAQRVFATATAPDSHTASALRAYMAFPALMLTLERIGVTDSKTLLAAAARAEALNGIGDEHDRRAAMMQFQSLVGILERMRRSTGIPSERAGALVQSLAGIGCSRRGYEGRIASWIREALLPALRPAEAESSDQDEDTLLAAMAGAGDLATSQVVEWEGRKYRVSPGRAETLRLRRVRHRQGGLTLSAAIEMSGKSAGDRAELALAETLTSILYAAHLGDPNGPAVNGDNIALRHELGGAAPAGPRGRWRLPFEVHGPKGWHISGSLLGLDVALARMALRRLDAGAMPPEPKMVSAERQTAALTVALSNPMILTDITRDEIAAALGRGRARLAALDGHRATVEDVARDAGLSGWRRESLAWAAANDRTSVASHLSLVETMWLGKPRSSPALSLNGWGAAALPRAGCVCLIMPRAGPWEPWSGRPSLGLLGTNGADVSILVADTLASLKMPAQLASGVIAYAMQEAVDQSRPSYFDDWSAFSRATMAVPRDMLVDFIAAQAAGGPLIPAKAGPAREP